MLKKILNIAAVRYLLIGGLSFLAETLILFTLHSMLGLGHVLSVGISFWFGLIFSFVFQKMFTFRDFQKERRAIYKQSTLFLLLVAANYVFTLFIVGLMSPNLLLLSRALAILITTTWNYYIYRKVIFRKNETDQKVVIHKRELATWVASLPAVLLLIGLAVLCFFIEPNGDDFCLIGNAANNSNHLLDLALSSGRHSTIFFLKTLYLVREPLTTIPLISLTAFISTSFLLLFSASKSFSFKWRSTSAILLSLSFTVALTLSIHNLYQAVFWSSAVIVYFLPLSFLNIFLSVLLLLQQKKKTTYRIILFLSAGLLALLVSLFNELFIGLVPIISACILAISVATKRSLKNNLIVFSITAFTSISSMVIYLSSSGTSKRISSAHVPVGMSEIITKTMSGFWWHISHQLFSLQTLPFLLVPFACFLFTKPFRQKLGAFLSKKQALIIITIFTATAVLSKLWVIALIYYAQTDFPQPRVLLPTYFIDLLSLCGIMFIIRSTFRPTIKITRYILAILVVAYVAGLVSSGHNLLEVKRIMFNYRSLSKSEQRNIAAAKQRKETDVVVDLNIIPSLGWPNPQPGFWLNRCMAEWYGVDNLKAGRVMDDKTPLMRPDNYRRLKN